MAEPLDELTDETGVVRLLGTVPLFTECTTSDLAHIADAMTELRFDVGEHLITQGERATSFMVITSGTVVVIRDGVEVETLGAGDFIGELALMFDVRRTATVKATSPVRAVLADREEFNHLLAEVDGLAERVASSAADRTAIRIDLDKLT